MTDTRVLLDPTAERSPAKRERLARPASLAGLTIGLLDISKTKGDIFLDQIETQLVERGLVVKRFQKPTFARVAPTELKQAITAECDVVIEALAD
jgi:hypothetical protein